MAKAREKSTADDDDLSAELTAGEDAVTRVRPVTPAPPPDDPERITATGVSFTYPGAEEEALRDVTVTINRPGVVAGSGGGGNIRSA